MATISGAGIDLVLPQGKIIFWSALVQATFSQFVQLKDSKDVVIFTAQGGSPDGHSATQIGQGFFQSADPQGKYTLWLGTPANHGTHRWSDVLMAQDTLTANGSTFLTKYVFGTEDGSDGDYNDTYLEMQWFEYLG